MRKTVALAFLAVVWVLSGLLANFLLERNHPNPKVIALGVVSLWDVLQDYDGGRH
jgi:hypothetical protein